MAQQDWGSVPLPVALTSFKANVEKNEVKLSWHTASEHNNKYFEVQHSIDGNNFTAIGTIPGKGTTTIPSDYSFSHTNPVAGVNYYRLKQIDIDDRYEYSDVITAKINYRNLTSLYPNPIKEKLIISSSVNTEANLLNEAGQKLQSIKLVQGRNELGISKLQGGVYFIKFSDGSIQKFNVIK
ncbi:MAG TPA: T9SS type A sorting domain-containing protein [Chitinophagaceae bacterium]|nr:T9SS type A sorting domain-containing protein [Chitinophagaceae bacterium]